MSPRPDVSIGTGSRAFLVSAFFASGAVGLAYEVAWSRALLLLLGSTATASAIVLGVFVGALGLGARWGGVQAERSERPLRLYGIFEIAAAALALLSLPLISLLETPYVSIATGTGEVVRLVLRIVVATIVVAPAAFLLGATLPAMVRHWVQARGGAGRGTAWLYGVNTVGAVLGCLWTGFSGIEAFGIDGVLRVAAGAGVVIGVLALSVAARGPARSVGSDAASSVSAVSKEALWLAFVCGFIGLSIEVLGFRILVFFVEGFTVTFTAMLGVFIAGLGIGSLVLGPWMARTQRPRRLLGVLLLVDGVVLVIALFGIVPNLEDVMRDIKASAYAGAGTQAQINAALRQSSLLGSALLLFVPALLMGPTFSLCVRFTELRGADPAIAVGRTYLGNALGSVTAPLVMTFGIVPWLGVLGAWEAVTVLTLAAGIVLCVVVPRLRDEQRSALSSAVAWVGVVVAAALVHITNATGTSTRDLVEASVVLHDRPDRRLVDTATDAVTTASVVETRTGERYLYTDDFAAAATGRYYRYMRMLGHLPALLSDRAENAMVIAFGTGTTAGAVARHESVKRMEVVEVSPAVLELADYFGEANRYVLRDPRTVKVLDDGRNALLLHEADLDIITLEPLMPYSPAGLPFYTKEFYELAKSRMREGGVVCQWVPVHAMQADLYAAFVRTFFEVFPEGSLWFFEQSTALIGRKGTAQPDAATLAARMEAPDVRADLVEAGFTTPWMFASGFVARGADVLAAPPLPDDRYAGRPVRDRDPYPEFQPTPRASLNTRYLTDTLGWLWNLVEPTKVPTDLAWWPPEGDPPFRRGTKLGLEARGHQARAEYMAVGARSLAPQARADRLAGILQDYDTAAERYLEATVSVPGDRVLKRRRVTALRSAAYIRIEMALLAANLAKRRGETGERERWLRQAEGLARRILPPLLPDPEPEATDIHVAAQLHARTLLMLGRCDEALAVLRRVTNVLPPPKTGPHPLKDLTDAVQSYVDGGSRAVPPRWKAFFADAAPCREEGLAPVKSEWEALQHAWESASRFEAIRGRGRVFVQAALREGVRDAAAGSVRGLPPGPDVAYRALKAVMLAQLDAADVTLRDLLREPDDAACAAALREVADANLLHRYMDDVDQLYARSSPDVALALAKAAAQDTKQRFDCLLVEMLMHREVGVRKEAVTRLFTRADDVLEDYDHAAPASERRPIYEAVKKRFNCP